MTRTQKLIVAGQSKDESKAYKHMMDTMTLHVGVVADLDSRRQR